MNIPVHLLVLVTAACLCAAHASPDLRPRTKQQRPTRGFKNIEMMTARGFGKRDNKGTSREPRDVSDDLPPTRDSRSGPIFKSSSIGIARDFGKRAQENVEEISSTKEFKYSGAPTGARSFGKRTSSSDYDEEEEESRIRRSFKPMGKVLIARGFGKRNNVLSLNSVYGEQPEETPWETLDQPGELDPNDSRDDRTDSDKENVKLRHTVDAKKQRRLSKSQPRSVKSMKEKGSNKTKLTGEKKKKPAKPIGSITVDTFTKEMIKNPDFAKTVVRRFIDRNLDGYLSEDELLKVNA